MTLTSLTGLLNTLSSLSLAVFVFSKKPKHHANQAYLFFGLAVGLYSAGYFLWGLARSEAEGLFAFKILTSGIILINSAYLEFVFSLLGERQKKRRILWVCHAVNLYFIYAVFSLRLFKSVALKNIWGYWPVVENLFFGYFTLWLGQFLYGLFNLYIGYKRRHGQQSTQIKYVFISTLIGYFGGATNWLPWFNITFFPPHLNILVTAYVAILAYAVVRHQLMDIEVIIKKTLVFTGLFAMAMGVVATVTTLTQRIIGDYLRTSPMISTIISVLIAMLLYDPARRFLVSVTDRFLFQKKEDVRIILRRLSENIVTILDLEKVGKTILSTLQEGLRLEAGAILIQEENKDQYHILDSFGISQKETKFDKEDLLIRHLSSNRKVINLEDPDERSKLPTAIQGTLSKLNAVIAIPLFFQMDLIGILLLGKKKSDQSFTQEDIDYFPTVASQAALALRNAGLYDTLMKSQVDFMQQAKMAAIGTLSAGIGHEIKNPLAAIRAGVEMLKFNKKLGVYKEFDKVQYEAAVEEVLDRVLNNVVRATGVMDRLSGFAKKPKEIKVEPVKLEQALEDVLHFVKQELEHYNILLKKEFAPNLPSITADTHAIEEVFMNIIINARHAIKEKGIIRLATLRHENEVEVAIQDTGPGIPAENLEKIFDPFFTTKDTTRNPDKEAIKGTGLGLFLVRQIVKQYGGRIEVESKLGKGTTFHIFFPIPKDAVQNV